MTVMIGLIESIVPTAARAPLIRPPRLRYSSVSRATNRSTSALRSSRTRAISVAETPSAASSAPICTSCPSPIDAVRESITWISRSGSRPRATCAAFRVPDRSPETFTHTTASAPPANAASNALLKSPGEAAAVVGNGASGAVIRSQNWSVVRSTLGRKLSGPKLTTSGTTAIPCAAATSGGMSLAESVTNAT